ncbi:MAG TPA: LCP family protein, partial [Syntrophomonadaceae bacterium]|nr:LCP family protein [Syntrophomonadaceae bacterium]
ALIGGQFSNPSIETKASKGQNINILFMGIDARDTKSNSRSDTMIVASINTKTKKVVLVSVPRDTRVKTLTGRSVKINSINYTGGPEAACKEVSKLLDLSIDHYVVTNFYGFGKIVNTLGGVHIDVDSDMYHADPVNPELAINISKGYQYLNGKEALAYVRYRGGPTADIGRTQRQQKFIKALAKEMFKPATIVKLPKLIPEIEENVHTNIPVSDMLYLAKMAKDFDKPNSIIAQTLPGYPYTEPSSGASYWEVDKEAAHGIVAKLFKGEKFDIVSDPPDWLEKQKDYQPTPAKDLEKIQQEVEQIQQEEQDTTDNNTNDITNNPDENSGQTDQGQNGTTNEGNGDNTTTPGEEQQPGNGEQNTPPANEQGNQTDQQTDSNTIVTH